MAHNYLLELHELIDTRMSAAKGEKTSAQEEGRILDAAFHDGRLSVLAEMDGFLTRNFDPKLPRKIREGLAKKRG